jgi:hypothetical protein
MQIHLQHIEIIQALSRYISSKGVSLDSKTVQVTFTTDRRKVGLCAEIVIAEAESSGAERGGRSAAADPLGSEDAGHQARNSAGRSGSRASGERDAGSQGERPAQVNRTRSPIHEVDHNPPPLF